MTRPLISAASTVELDPRLAARIVDHAQAERPWEACGLLLGHHPAHVVSAVPCHNIAADPRHHFEIGPDETLSVMRDGDACHFDILGVYHSHPFGPDGPSMADRDEVHDDDWLMVIVNLADLDEPSVTVWIR